MAENNETTAPHDLSVSIEMQNGLVGTSFASDCQVSVPGPNVVYIDQAPDGKALTTQQLAHLLKPGYPAKVHECFICGCTFSLNKSLLRHLRTVHRPKAFRCPQCGLSFMRKDTRDRHVAELHDGKRMLVKCLTCGRYISARACLEHMDSHVCKQARALFDSGRFDGLQFKYPGQDDDAFLVTVRMFLDLNLTFSSRTGSPVQQLNSRLFSRDQKGELIARSQYPHDLAKWWRSYGQALDLLKQQTSGDFTAFHISAALWLTSLLLGLMSFAAGWDKDAWFHWKGAEAILIARHGHTCGCNDYKSCRNWRMPTMRDPTMALIGQLFEDHGFTQARAPILHTKMSEDNAMVDICLHHFKMLEIFSRN